MGCRPFGPFTTRAIAFVLLLISYDSPRIAAAAQAELDKKWATSCAAPISPRRRSAHKNRMARRRPSGGGGAAALAKYFLLVWAVALGALVVLHERSIADEVRREWSAVEGEVRKDWAAVEGAVEREAHYLLDGMKAPPSPAARSSRRGGSAPPARPRPRPRPSPGGPRLRPRPSPGAPRPRCSARAARRARRARRPRRRGSTWLMLRRRRR